MTQPEDPSVPDQPSGQANPGGYPPPPPPPPLNDPPAGYGNSQKTNTLAIIAMVAAFVCAPAGIIMGFIARGQIKERGEAGAGLAKAAIIVGIVVLCLNIIYAFSGGFNATNRGY